MTSQVHRAPSKPASDPVPGGRGRAPHVAARARVGRPGRFVLLAFSLSWIVWIPGFLAAPANPLVLIAGAFGPAAAAAVMVRADGRRIRDWLRTIAVVRVSWRWYAVALGLPLLQTATVTAVAAARGVPVDASRVGELIPLFVGTFVFALLLGGGQEEFGWRGYLLPALQERTGPLVASVLIGVVWALWHVPLFVLPVGGSPGPLLAAYVPFAVVMSVVFTWLCNSTRGSVVLAMLMHAAVNASSTLVPVGDPTQLEAVATTAAWAVPAVFAVVAVAIAVATRGRLGPAARR